MNQYIMAASYDNMLMEHVIILWCVDFDLLQQRTCALLQLLPLRFFDQVHNKNPFTAYPLVVATTGGAR